MCLFSVCLLPISDGMNCQRDGCKRDLGVTGRKHAVELQQGSKSCKRCVSSGACSALEMLQAITATGQGPEAQQPPSYPTAGVTSIRI